MKPNPERQWIIQFWGPRGELRQVNFRGTVAAALAHADEQEDEFDWEAVNITLHSYRTE